MIDPSQTSKPRIALAHDWLVGLRGGEWVLDRLARLYGPADLYTLVDDRRPLTPAIDACRVVTSPLQKLPGASGKLRRHYLPLYRWAVESLRIPTGSCDLVISTSSAVMKSIRPPDGVPHLCYCHSPARYLWDQTDDYAIGAGGGMRSLGLRMFQKRFREWDRRTCHRVTRFLANSRHTAERIKRCYDHEADVVYPPVRTGCFTVDESIVREPWFLVVSALEPYKRTDMVIEAANRSGVHLKVAGGGSQFDALKGLAGPKVELLGRVSDATLCDLYRRAGALIFPQVEDFGITAVEAQACGCPVIAFAGGGAMETVTSDTGVFFNSQSVDALIAAIESFGSKRFNASTIRKNAERFSDEVFDAAIERHVKQLLDSRS
jgi:glycosyltransferase involved in cell wall biosynthesis